ncbi:MAG: DUF805 domain-containing protein [Selenomonadaceae bacterium]|nr:DUF805 domain-containing protein [Selenomonadaceae bacterium]
MQVFNEIFTTNGRLNRKRYLIYMIILALSTTAVKITTTAMITLLTGDPTGTLVMMITLMLVLIAGTGNIMMIIRRLHDMGKSGYFALLVFVPVVGAIFSIALFFIPGQVGWNEYGSDPLAK